MLVHNNNPIVTKDLRKEIMERSKLKNSLNKNRHHANYCMCKTQRNYCLNLLRKTKSKYFKSLRDNESFWKNVEPIFSTKGSSSEKITLVENITVLTEEKEIEKIMSNFLKL